MVTFYECLQEYYKREDAIQFSNKRIKRMSGYCKYVFDSRENSKITYTQSKEGDQIFTVRSYPDSFKRVIVDTIEKAHIHQKSLGNTLNSESDKKILEEIYSAPPDIVVPSRGQSALMPLIPIMNNMVAAETAKEEILKRAPRKRHPIVKPAYSAKPKKEDNG